MQEIVAKGRMIGGHKNTHKCPRRRQSSNTRHLYALHKPRSNRKEPLVKLPMPIPDKFLYAETGIAVLRQILALVICSVNSTKKWNCDSNDYDICIIYVYFQLGYQAYKIGNLASFVVRI
jgi:hypothetical protein